MRKVNSKSIIVIATIISYLILSCLLLINKFSNTYNSIINPMFWILLAVVCFILFRNEYVNKKFRLDILQTVIITVVGYFIFYYILGFIVGFQDTPYSSGIKAIFKNIWNFGIIIIFQEYVRQVLVNRSGRSKALIVIITILFTFVDITRILTISKIDSGAKLFQTFVITINPAIARSMLLTYLTYKADFLPSLAYKIPLIIYSFIVPFIPNLNWFLLGVIDLLLPFVVFARVYRLLYKREKVETNRKKYKGMLAYTPIFIVLIILVILVSGAFKYQLIAIASNSMNPAFYRGDAIILKKVDKEERKNIKVGEVIVYNSDGAYIVHRVIEKKETMTGAYLYKTKGDNNNAPDTKLVEASQIVGKFTIGIKYIGYPTVMLQEALARR